MKFTQGNAVLKSLRADGSSFDHVDDASPRVLKALTVKQPWASLIVEGFKDVENRTWRTHYRGPLYVHAALRDDTEASELLSLGDPVIRGAIIGTVEVVDCVRDSDSEWAELDCWHWLLDYPATLDEPIPMKGSLGLWTPRLALVG